MGTTLGSKKYANEENVDLLLKQKQQKVVKMQCDKD